MKNVKIYDNGGETFDRYTAVYMQHPEKQKGTFTCRGMSENPFHHQGFGQMCIATPGKHLGKRIKFEELPINCQKLILQDLTVEV